MVQETGLTNVVPMLSETYSLLNQVLLASKGAPRFNAEAQFTNSDLVNSIVRFNEYLVGMRDAFEVGASGEVAEQAIRLRIEAMNISQDFSNLAGDIALLIRDGVLKLDKE